MDIAHVISRTGVWGTCVENEARRHCLFAIANGKAV